MGRELGLPVMGLMQWGDRYLAGPAGPPGLARHRDCGGRVHLAQVCDSIGAVAPDEVDLVPGPGARRRPHDPSVG